MMRADLPWLRGAPWWARIALILGPPAVVAGALTWVLVLDVQHGLRRIEKGMVSLLATIETQQETLRRVLSNQDALLRIERINLVTCINNADTVEQRERCYQN